MAKLIGKWHVISSDNFGEYLTAINIKPELKAKVLAADIVVDISTEKDDTWTILTSCRKNTLPPKKVTFKLGQEFDEDTGGKQVKSTVTADGETKLIQSYKGEIPTTATRELINGELVMTCVVNDVKAKRIYEKI